MLEDAGYFVFLALSVASVYLLIAIGLSIIFGSLKFVNMAHGALFLMGGYIGLLIAESREYSGGIAQNHGELGLDLGLLAALILTPIVIFLVGIVMERLLAKPLYERELLDQLLVTFGVLIIFQEIFVLLFGSTSVSYSLDDAEWASGGLSFPVIGTPPGLGVVSMWQFYVVIGTIILTVLIFAFFRYTDYGLAVRAGTEDSEMTTMLGIRVGRPFLLIFAVGAAYAGLAGILSGAGAESSLTPRAGMNNIIPALIIVIMGGVGKLRGTVAAAVLAGLAYSVFTHDPTGTLNNAARSSIYLLAIVVLTIRPSGIIPTPEIK